jgi:hypothetical protein
VVGEGLILQNVLEKLVDTIIKAIFSVCKSQMDCRYDKHDFPNSEKSKSLGFVLL